MISQWFPDVPSFPLGFGQFSQGLTLHEAHPGALGASPQRAGALLRAHTQKLRDALDSAGKMGKWMENGWEYVEKMAEYGKPNQLGLEYVGKNGLEYVGNQLGCGKNGLEHVTKLFGNGRSQVQGFQRSKEDGNWSHWSHWSHKISEGRAAKPRNRHASVFARCKAHPARNMLKSVEISWSDAHSCLHVTAFQSCGASPTSFSTVPRMMTTWVQARPIFANEKPSADKWTYGEHMVNIRVRQDPGKWCPNKISN